MSDDAWFNGNKNTSLRCKHFVIFSLNKLSL